MVPKFLSTLQISVISKRNIWPIRITIANQFPSHTADRLFVFIISTCPSRLWIKTNILAEFPPTWIRRKTPEMDTARFLSSGGRTHLAVPHMTPNPAKKKNRKKNQTISIPGIQGVHANRSFFVCSAGPLCGHSVTDPGTP